jgi:hypothetical protein
VLGHKGNLVGNKGVPLMDYAVHIMSYGLDYF